MFFDIFDIEKKEKKLSTVAGGLGGNIILLMLEFNSLSSSNFLSS